MSRKVTRREFVSSALTGTALAGAAIAGAGVNANSSLAQRLPARGRAARPNILFILADDLGYGDLSCYGRPDYQTPHLDRLATQGVRFVKAYSASPVCTPTRCAFITGRYPARTRVGLEEPLTEPRDLGQRVKTLGLPPEHPTIASLLKQSGYQTALIGKWHLGYLPNFGPVQSGFDEFFGIMTGAADFFTHKDMAGDNDLYEGKVAVERIGYTTEMLTRRAVEYIANKGKARTTRNPYFSGATPIKMRCSKAIGNTSEMLRMSICLIFQSMSANRPITGNRIPICSLNCAMTLGNGSRRCCRGRPPGSGNENRKS